MIGAFKNKLFMFKTRMTLFNMWNTKEDILQNVQAAVCHTKTCIQETE